MIAVWSRCSEEAANWWWWFYLAWDWEEKRGEAERHSKMAEIAKKGERSYTTTTQTQTAGMQVLGVRRNS
jgi:uncharacterized protein (DUF169 family)